MDTLLMLGNEAVARGAWEAGVHVAAAYPGTPSTEIVTSLARYEGVYAEWSTNEKVAYEVAFGASMGGARALTAMKSAGASVAADPLITSVYTGVNGGLVVCLAGDPGMASGMTEQDDRYFGRMSSMPMLEPADSQECYDFVKLAFELSETYDVPVMVRLSIQTAHQKSIVRVGERQAVERKPPHRKTEKYSLLPRFSRPMHRSLIERFERLTGYAEATAASGELARVEPGAALPGSEGSGWVPLAEGGHTRIGVVAAGAACISAKEALPGAALLKLGMIHPLPVEAVRRFAATVDRLFVVEELEPYLEEQLLAAGISCEGKRWFPQWGELTPVRVGRGFVEAGLDLPRWAEEKAAEDDSVIPRPPVLCTGCPHRGMARAMKKLDLDVHGDIGCYDLTTLPPVEHMHSAFEMGASIPIEQGFTRAGGGEHGGSIAVIGDSTFLHSGITGLLNAVHQRTNVTVLIQDNRITAMTGGQTNPHNERTLAGVDTKPVDLAAICRALGVEHVAVVDPYDYQACLDALKAGLAFDGPAVIITNRPCMLFPSKAAGLGAFAVDEELCNACQLCMSLGCPSLHHVEATHKGRHKVAIDTDTCAGCSLCEQLCGTGAIRRVDASDPEGA
ncbi:MAG: indolepyruvate ferredoxin oxidoreductase subunit alpha [Thermoleophilia bacterium]|nr:indolepyruvate ferredoxin oxidoreductase subunit alpha [Thermoleophilia bacterium]